MSSNIEIDSSALLSVIGRAEKSGKVYNFAHKNFYVIKTDKKNENFENYFFKGKRVKNLFRTYNSSNTKRLDEKELTKILSKLFF